MYMLCLCFILKLVGYKPHLIQAYFLEMSGSLEEKTSWLFLKLSFLP